MDEINQIIERLMTPPTYIQGIAIFVMGIVLWARQKPFVFAFFLIMLVLGVVNGVSLLLVVPFGLTILYANGLIRSIRAMSLAASQRVARKFDDVTLSVLGIAMSALLVGTGITIGFLGDVVASVVFDLTVLGAMISGSALFLAYFISRRMKGRAHATVYFFPFVMQFLIPNIIAGYNQTQYFVLSFLPITAAFLFIPVVMIWYFKLLLTADDSLSEPALLRKFADKVATQNKIQYEQFYAQMATRKPSDCTLEQIECFCGGDIFHVGLIRREESAVAVGISRGSNQTITDEEKTRVIRTVAFTEVARSTPKNKFSMRRLFTTAAATVAVSSLNDAVEAWKQNIGKKSTDEMRTKLDITGVETRLLLHEESKAAQGLFVALSVGSKCSWESMMTLATDSLSNLISVLEREIDPWTKRAIDYRQAYSNSASLRAGERMMGFGNKNSAQVRLELVKSRLESIRTLKRLLETKVESETASMMKLPALS